MPESETLLTLRAAASTCTLKAEPAGVDAGSRASLKLMTSVEPFTVEVVGDGAVVSAGGVLLVTAIGRERGVSIAGDVLEPGGRRAV